MYTKEYIFTVRTEEFLKYIHEWLGRIVFILKEQLFLIRMCSKLSREKKAVSATKLSKNEELD